MNTLAVDKTSQEEYIQYITGILQLYENQTSNGFQEKTFYATIVLFKYLEEYLDFVK